MNKWKSYHLKHTFQPEPNHQYQTSKMKQIKNHKKRTMLRLSYKNRKIWIWSPPKKSFLNWVKCFLSSARKLLNKKTCQFRVSIFCLTFLDFSDFFSKIFSNRKRYRIIGQRWSCKCGVGKGERILGRQRKFLYHHFHPSHNPYVALGILQHTLSGILNSLLVYM